MPAKHFVNDPTRLVASALRSLSITNPSVTIDAENKVVYSRSHGSKNAVSIISGGGSGHEPSFGGFVGSGLLTASVAGTIFASPSAKQVLAAIERVDSSKGVLVTVMNYTGDVLNFGVAVEKAKARNPLLRAEMLVVGDDVGVPRSRSGKVGRRGIAGTVLVHKVTGALAAEGYDLDTVARIGNLVSRNIVSIGVSLDRVHVPGRPKEESGEHVLGPEEVELGMGIHNEAGSGRKSGQEADLPALVEEMLRQLLDVSDKERGFLQHRSEELVLLVNNLGAMSVLELGAVVTEVTDQLKKLYHVTPVRVYAGTYMTSLDGPGFSITLLNVIDTGINTTLVQLLDEPSEAVGWTAPIRTETWATERKTETNGYHLPQTTDDHLEPTDLKCDLDLVLKRLKAGLQAVITAEPEVTKYDSIVGDGDCGTTLKRGAEGILAALSSKPPTNIISLLSTVSASVEDNMDGTSGALYSIFLNALTQAFSKSSSSASSSSSSSSSSTVIVVDTTFWTTALNHASAALSKYTPAKPGDRTLVDALDPFTSTLKATGNLRKAASAAVSGAEKTKDLKASLGRTVYVGNEEEWVGKIPDPGAWGLCQFFEGLASHPL